MTDKEKQFATGWKEYQAKKKQAIEEMAKDMGVSFQLAGTTRFGAVAEALIRFGWIKPSKDSVVLSKEEFELLTDIKDLQQQVQDSLSNMSEDFERIEKQTRKETAEKIYKLVDNNLDLYKNGVIGETLYDSGYQTAISNIKQKIKDIFGVEIKE